MKKENKRIMREIMEKLDISTAEMANVLGIGVAQLYNILGHNKTISGKNYNPSLKSFLLFLSFYNVDLSKHDLGTLYIARKEKCLEIEISALLADFQGISRTELISRKKSIKKSYLMK